jgi:hypothetical protein
MAILQRKTLYELAAAASPVKDASKERLLDTTAWLDAVSRQGFRPVLAMQSPTHQDAGHDPTEARHLVVAAREDGVAYTLLNSHDRLMRVWAGLGVWDGEDVLIRSIRPVQRWRGVDKSQWGLEAFVRDLERDVTVMQKAKISAPALAERIAKEGYVAGRGRPSVRGLLAAASCDDLSALQCAFSLLAAARVGNLEPSTAKNQRRNVKGVRRPDMYQHMAMAAYKAARELAGK